MHIRIARKEAKESHYWLRLLDLEAQPELVSAREDLVREADELVRIFAAIVRKRSS